MKCTYKNLVNDINRGDLVPVYFFYGREELLKEEAVQSLIQKAVPPDLRDFNLDILYGDETDWVQIIDRISALPMMAERRVVVVRDVNNLEATDKRKILQHLSTPFDHTCLILTAPDVDASRGFYKNLASLACHVNFYPLNDKLLFDWVQRRIQRYGKSIVPEAVQILCDSIGESLIALDNEIQKLAIYVEEKPTIEARDVAAVVGKLRSQTVFKLCDAVGRGDLPEAMTLLSQLQEAGAPRSHIVWAIRQHFVKLARVGQISRKGKSAHQIAVGLHIPKKHVNDIIQQSANLDEDDLEKAFAQIYETELKLKTGSQEPRMAMTLLVYHLCRPMGDWEDV
ncbi:MAG: hypothetical protein AMJ92_01445 [candidate division Zixibacteria bacterium SM23_81]|nr:MAG: hypothetical protein AMJ92_01445 [candidate division Zixibacteria bacterium SM23_81]